MNYLAIIIAAVVNMVLGAVWFSNALFAKQWVKLSGVSMKQMKGATNGYIVSAIASLVIAYVLAWVINLTGDHSLSNGIKVGLLTGVGLVASSMASDYVFVGKPMQLFNINAGYRVVAMVLMGAVLGAMA